MQANGDAFIVTCFLSTCGTAFSIFLLVFNLKYRILRFIKMTSPNINIVILMSSIGLYACCILVIMDPPASFTAADATALYQVRIWLFNFSFTTFFAAMFAKGWRVSRLFHYSAIRRIVIRDATLFGIIVAFVAGNSAILLLWFLIDPLKCTPISGGHVSTPSNSSNWPAMRAYYSNVTCQSNYHYAWVCALFLYAFAVLCCCTRVSWQIRHIRSPSLDDSRSILLTVDATLAISTLAAWFDRTLAADESIATQIIYSCSLWTFTTLSLCFNFASKVHMVLKYSGKEPAQSASSKYIGNDFRTDRVLAQITAEVSSTLTGIEGGIPEISEKPREESEDKPSIKCIEDPATYKNDCNKTLCSSHSKENKDVSPWKPPESVRNFLSRLHCLKECPSDSQSHSSSESQTTCVTRPPSSEGGENGHHQDAPLQRVVASAELPQESEEPMGDRNASDVRSRRASIACNDDLILSIASTYNLPDDMDTYSYISSWFPSRYYAFVSHEDNESTQLATIGSDQLYPVVQRQETNLHYRRKKLPPKSAYRYPTSTSHGSINQTVQREEFIV